MPRSSLTRVVTFSAAHRYHRPDWSEARNRETFGACANEHGHGHTYRCAVTVSGPLHPDTAMIVDLATLDQILDEEIVQPLDHQHINHAIPEFAFGRTIPTGEALAMYLWNRISPRLAPGVRLMRVRVQEDDRLYTDYYGPEDQEQTR